MPHTTDTVAPTPPRRASQFRRLRPYRKRPRGERRERRRERRHLAALLRTETVGGALLVIAAVAALVMANSPLAGAYAAARDWQIGPASLGLHLSIGEWTADGLLALFFFLAGLELKREFVVGELRDARRAAVPVAAAVGGMAVPAVVYIVVTIGEQGAHIGWAIPTATDIAFALAVLAVVGRHLPSALRTFLLTLAVVDDLLAIVVIALFYTDHVDLALLGVALIAIAAFGTLMQLRGRSGRIAGVTGWVVLPLLALVAWAAMHGSGVHATVAGVLMGFTVPVRKPRRAPRRRALDGSADQGRDGDGRSTGTAEYDAVRGASRRQAPTIADRLDRALRPLSAGVAVPLFAFFAAGVTVGGFDGLRSAFENRITIGIVAGLVVGKAVGIFAATVVTARLVRSPLLRVLGWPDLVGLAVLGGVGFTVSLLIGHLAFGGDAAHAADVQIGVATGSLVAAAVAALLLGARNRHYRIREAALARGATE